MVSLCPQRILLLLLLFSFVSVRDAHAQTLFSAPVATSKFGSSSGLDGIQAARMDSNFFLMGSKNPDGTPLQTPSGSVSVLDLKAPGKARSEFEKGYQLLMKKDLAAAIEHLTKSISIYPSFVAAHNALGTAYFDQGHHELARTEFASAVRLDDHLPNSYLNLGMAHLALKENAEAEESLKKASKIAPMDAQLMTALAYGEFQNHDYAAVIATARQAHEHKHVGAAMVHYYAAAAWEAQNKLPEAQQEMETLLREDPKSPSAEQFKQILNGLKAEQVRQAEMSRLPSTATTVAIYAPAGPAPEDVAQRVQKFLEDTKEKNQIAEAEAEPEAKCANCGTLAPRAPSETGMASSSIRQPEKAGMKSPGSVLRVDVDEVAVFFAATEHGKSVTDLKASDIEIRDDSKPPQAITGFRNESQLPLRLGLVIDTSNSILDRFLFEQTAAGKFLQTVANGKSDLAFVVGVNNSVLLVQDFTGDQTLTSRAVSQLAPGGGTALWDAVAFAAEKLSSHSEEQPVAKMIVVFSDGEDNSSSVTLKQAIEKAQQGEVAVYTVSTRDGSPEESGALVGDHALRTLSELTGGANFVPGSLHSLNGSLADLQQVIRGRYLVSYKAAAFERDGRYRTIDLKAEKDGHKLRVYARKGYYAATAQAAPAVP
jgi:Ca-activated chloride channel family protein